MRAHLITKCGCEKTINNIPKSVPMIIDIPLFDHETTYFSKESDKQKFGIPIRRFKLHHEKFNVAHYREEKELKL